ncbi:molybdopterin-containing oxidoreductase family protein [Parvibacter caecicola]|uniref:molybdopterin-containing oxidoreductase family protein n=1 Tax=Parvibacter caecicola TaxID=747645 RepID=UPI0023F1A978|nr:molybdopterin-dependent oxidoreductase [Parvibacter caecicola]
MSTLTMSRRSFVKTAAASAAVAAFVGASAPLTALAENEAAPTSGGTVTRIRSTCRGCGKVECGVWVYVQDGKVIRTEGDDDCFLTMGNHCSKGQASIQAAYHPDRIKYPMKRTNPKGDDDPGWTRISWDEAYQTIADNILEITDKYGRESTFTWCGTGRQWCMQSDAGMALTHFGTPNIVAAYQVCKGPRHFSSRLDNVQAWSWSEVINHSTKFVQWATDQSISNYDDASRTVVDVARCADAFISVDPRQSNLGRTAKYWLPIRPGTDNAMGLGWCHVILKKDLVDWPFVKRWSNAPFIVVPDMAPTGYEEHVQNGGYPWAYQTRLLTEADIDPAMVDWEVVGDGDPQRYLVFDQLNNRWTYWQAHPAVGEAHWEGENWTKSTSYFDQDLSRLRDDESKKPGKIYDISEFNPMIDPALYGTFEVKLKDGTTHEGRPVWDLWAEYLEGFDPQTVSEITTVDADLIETAVTEWATRDDPRIPNGGINYGLGVEHAGNSTQNCRAIMAACAMVGAIDTPGGQRGATNGWTTQSGPTAMMPGTDIGIGFDRFPMDIYNRIAGYEKHPLLYWYAVWADANSTMECAHQEANAPYHIHGGMIGSGDHMNMGNAAYNWEALLMLDFLFEANLWHSPTSGAADILLPVCHWLEMNAVRITQGSGGGLGLCVRTVDPPGECRSDPLYFMELAPYFGLASSPYPDDPNYEKAMAATGKTLDILALEHECFEAELNGGCAPYSSWDEFVEAYQEHGTWNMKEVFPDDWGTYRRFEVGQAYRKAPHQQPTKLDINIPGFPTPTMKHEFWCTAIESHYPDGTDGPELAPGFKSEALPYYVEPEHGPVRDAETYKEYPITCITGRRIPVYFHSEHRQLPWCRELWPAPRMEINPETAAELGLDQGDWVWIESPWGKVRETVDLYYGIRPGMINAEHQWWYPELGQADKGFTLSCINCITDRNAQDKYNGSSTVRCYPVKVYKATAENSPFGNPVPCGNDGTEIIHDASDPRLKLWEIGAEGIHPDNFGE